VLLVFAYDFIGIRVLKEIDGMDQNIECVIDWKIG